MELQLPSNLNNLIPSSTFYSNILDQGFPISIKTNPSGRRRESMKEKKV